MRTDRRKEASPEEMLETYIKAHGGRQTPERRAVLACVQAMAGEFRMPELMERIERDGMAISRATVYSSLRLMEEAGLLSSHRIEGAGGRIATLYNVCQKPAASATKTPVEIHTVCRSCGRIRRIKPDNELERALRARRFGAFTADNLEINIYGRCSRCKSKKRN